MGLNCIIIDDSLFIRETVKEIIEGAGHSVIAQFASGSEVLNNIAQYIPDVIFCDIILPEMTGLDLLNLLTEGFPKAKIYMLSGVTQGEAISAALRLGALDFIQKPVNRERVISLLDKISETELAPPIENMSTVGIACAIISGFLVELLAHSAATFRMVISNQSQSILLDLSKPLAEKLNINLNSLSIEPLHQFYTEEDVSQILRRLTSIPRDLSFELEFLYSENVVNDLYDRTIQTMGAKKEYQLLFDKLPPNNIGLPTLPTYADPSVSLSNKAGTSYIELDNALSIAYFSVGIAGPGLIDLINFELLTEGDIMNGSSVYYTLIGDDPDLFQEGIYGPMPVTSEKSALVSSIAYIFKKPERQGEEKILILPIFFSPKAENLVSDLNRISDIIYSYTSVITHVEEIDRGVLRNILDEIIDYLLEE